MIRPLGPSPVAPAQLLDPVRPLAYAPESEPQPDPDLPSDAWVTAITGISAEAAQRAAREAALAMSSLGPNGGPLRPPARWDWRAIKRRLDGASAADGLAAEAERMGSRATVQLPSERERHLAERRRRWGVGES